MKNTVIITTTTNITNYGKCIDAAYRMARLVKALKAVRS